ncbi:hypothetical protein ACLQ24_28765, partial [Micromonospora sp. DT4]
MALRHLRNRLALLGRQAPPPGGLPVGSPGPAGPPDSIPLGITGAPANRHDSPLLRDTFEQCSAPLRHHWPQQVTAHLDRGYDSNRTRELLDEIGFDA